MTKIPYRDLIGALMFLASCMKLDILHAVTKLSQYNCNPRRIHWNQAKHILRYLSGTKECTIIHDHVKPQIQICCDADLTGDPDDRHSFSDMVTFIGNNSRAMEDS